MVVEIVTEPVPLSSGPDATDATEETQVRSLASAPPENTDTPTKGNEDPTDPPVSAPTVTNETDTPVVTSTQPETKEVAVIPEGAGSSYTVSFVNVYDPTDTSASFSGVKELTGRDLNEGGFTFALYATGDSFTVAEGMEPKQTVSNDASGNFAFENIACSEPGTFYYVVTEDDSAGVKGMTYDDAEYGIRVNVWDDGSGLLKASYAISVVGGSEVNAILFENSYTKPVDPPKPTDPTDPSDPSDPTDPTDPPETTDPTKPSTPVDPDVPPTGDESPVGLYFALVAISIVAIILLLLTGKKPKGRYLHK